MDKEELIRKERATVTKIEMTKEQLDALKRDRDEIRRKIIKDDMQC